MNSKQILEKYFEYFEKKGHKKIPNVSLVPENDPTLLFVNSGMFPLVPYLSGEPHPLGKRLINVQRSIRLEDLDEIGDPLHTLAFHMIGNWSLGDYFKEDQLNWKYDFFISVLKLDPQRIYASVFAGDKDAPSDEEAISILKNIFSRYGINAKENERIWHYGKEHNWWKRGDAVGELGGPSSEMFYYLGEGDPEGLSPVDHDTEFVELGNSVFMEYKKTKDGWERLPQSNIDYGGGLERIAMAIQNKKDIFETDNFYPIIHKIEEISGKKYLESQNITFSMRNLADHIRGCVFLAMDGVFPSNKDQGYILRRLLRRMVRSGRNLGMEKDISVSLVPVVVNMFEWIYPELPSKQNEIMEIFSKEEEKFRKTLTRGFKEFEKNAEQIKKFIKDQDASSLSSFAFDIYQSQGYPFEMFIEDTKELTPEVSAEFLEKIELSFIDKVGEHQDKSRAGADQKFKGGLADHSEQVVKYHTATHLLQMALRKVLGDHVGQIGSNITGERLRFDFTHPEKLTDEQIRKVEDIMNEVIKKELPVKFEMMEKQKAIDSGAIYMTNEQYPDSVKVYYVGESIDKAVSKEFCGGPHVKNTGEIGEIEIFKQESMGEGKQRIYAR